MSYRLAECRLMNPQYFLSDMSDKELCEIVLNQDTLLYREINGKNSGLMWNSVARNGIPLNTVIWLTERGAARLRECQDGSDGIESDLPGVPNSWRELSILPENHKELLYRQDTSHPDWIIVIGLVYVVGDHTTELI